MVASRLGAQSAVPTTLAALSESSLTKLPALHARKSGRHASIPTVVCNPHSTPPRCPLAHAPLLNAPVRAMAQYYSHYCCYEVSILPVSLSLPSPHAASVAFFRVAVA